MTSAWLDGYFTINVTNGTTQPTLETLDFRIAGRSVFVGILEFCRFFIVVTTSAQSVFRKDQFISATLISRKLNIIFLRLIIKS